MMIKSLKRKFTRPSTDDVGNPMSSSWIGDRNEAVLVDLGSGKVRAHVWYDYDGKYHPTVYVSPLRALWISRNHAGFLVSLLPLPRCAMQLIGLRSIKDAKSCVRFVLGGGE